MKITFEQIYKKVMSVLENDLPYHLTYHNSIHTKYVLEKSIIIAEKESICDHDLQLLKIAALYHDVGFIIAREGHEAEGCKIATEELNEIGLDSYEISEVCGMIMATKIPQMPKTQVEKILADADLEYLGTANFHYFSGKLFQELKYFQADLNQKQWLEIQIDFISRHSYHTEFCRKYKEPIKIANLEKIKKDHFYLK